jgi:hypothetical protein
MSMFRLARHRGARWSDSDRYFGPFTMAYSRRYRPIAVVLSSGTSDDEDAGPNLRFSAFGATLICEMPPIVKPDRRWVDTSQYEWSKGNPNAGYWDERRRDFGFSLSEGFLQVFRGAITHDSSTDKTWGYFLPWKQWRCVAHRLYGADGEYHADTKSAAILSLERDARWKLEQEIRDAVPTLSFAFEDYDGERNSVVTHIEEWDWRLGEKWCAWIGYLVPRKRRRSLMLNFASEVGREKGSWKGGVMGTSIDMLPGAGAEAAFRRYCDEEHRAKSGKYRIKFVGTLADAHSNSPHPREG